MRPVEIEQCADSEKILRFLDKDGLMKTLGIDKHEIPRQRTNVHPLFLLRSLRYYSNLEDHRGDQHENQIITRHPDTNVLLTNTNGNPILVSCWSCYQRSDLHDDKLWDVFPGSIAAVESNVGSIQEIFNWIAPQSGEHPYVHLENAGALQAMHIHHGKMKYYSELDHNAIYEGNIVRPTNCFFKRNEPYSNENEYRFIMIFSNHLHFYPEVYCVELKQTDYIKKIYLKGECLSKHEISKLNAYYANLTEII